MTHPTDALRLVPAEPTGAMLNAAMEAFPRSHPSVFPIIYRYMLAAAPASPLPGGGPTCQLCANKIEGWICQGCGAHFYENDAGALVLNTIPAAPTGEPK